MNISNSEIYIMDIIWANGGSLPAKDIASALQKQLSLSKTTVYTMINRLLSKGAISREKETFVCHALVKKDDVRREQTSALIDRLYDCLLYTSISRVLKEEVRADSVIDFEESESNSYGVFKNGFVVLSQKSISIYEMCIRDRSKPFNDFMYESNRGQDIFFVNSEEDAVEKLSSCKNFQGE